MQLTSSMCLSIDASATFRMSLSVLKIVTRASAVPATISLQQKRFKLDCVFLVVNITFPLVCMQHKFFQV